MKELRQYIKEVLLEISSQYSVDTFEQDIKRKWSVLEEYARVKRQGLLLENRELVLESRLLIEGVWQSVKGFFAAGAKKAWNIAQWLGKWAGKLSGKALKILKKVSGKLGEMIVLAIKSLPGGEMILEFITTVGTKIKEAIESIKAKIGALIEPWIKSAKEKLIKFFGDHVLKDPETRAEFLRAAGINESYRRYIKRIINESIIGTARGLSDRVDGAKEFDAIHRGKKEIDPDAFRKKFADQFDHLFKFWMKMVHQNPKKYHKPLYESGVFTFFGETGWGLALGSLIGLLSSGNLNWNVMVKYITSFMRGITSGDDRPKGSTSDRAGAFLFMGNSGSGFDASLLQDLIKGIVGGSNVEMILRAFSFDPTAGEELLKRLGHLIASGVMKALRPSIKKGLEEEAGEELEDDLIGEMEGALGEAAAGILGVAPEGGDNKEGEGDKKGDGEKDDSPDKKKT